jgi:hypothetical protein
MKKVLSFWERPAGWKDIVFLCGLAALVVFQPYFLHRDWELFELSLYLPGIQGILQGGVPYRDFFHLRGPLELYIPAWLMMVFGAQAVVMVLYFYFGNVLSLCLGILLGRELFRTRWILYLFTFVFVGRTFPRVVFTHWGGMRFAFGLLAVLGAVYAWRRNRAGFLFAAGAAAAMAILTSIEVGAAAFIAITGGMLWGFLTKGMPRNEAGQRFGLFLGGLGAVLLPAIIYFFAVGAAVPFGRDIYAVLTRMQYIFNPHIVSSGPPNFLAALPIMFQPASDFFKYLTPVYFYIAWLAFLFCRFRQFSPANLAALVTVTIYGLVLYSSAFRSIGASPFEMALQPEKILLFFLLEEAYFFLQAQRQSVLVAGLGRVPGNAGAKKFWGFLRLYGVVAFIFMVTASSLGYALARYQHRFFTFRWLNCRLTGKDTATLNPLAKIPHREVKVGRMAGFVFPEAKAEEIETITNFLRQNTRPGEKVFIYPEFGIYHFLADRPYVGRFPVPVFSWFYSEWHNDLMAQLEIDRPRYAVLAREYTDDEQTMFFSLAENCEKEKILRDYFAEKYTVVVTTPESWIMQRK